MAWSVSAGADQRVVAIQQLAETYLDKAIVADDRAASEQIFTLYLNDPSSRVRAAMAKSLAAGEDLPRTLLWALAEDVPEVSSQMYRASSQLRTKDLCYAVERKGDLVQIAIAERQSIDSEVARRVAEIADDRAVLALLENRALVLSPTLKHDIAVRLGDVADIRAALLADDLILAETRQLLASKLSSALLQFVDDKGWGLSQRLQETASDAANRVSVEIAERSSNEEMENYTTHMCRTEQLTPAFLIRAICSGNAALFEASMAKLSGASLKRVQGILDERRMSAFKALYQKTNLPTSAFPVFSAAVAIWQNCDDDLDAVMQIIDRVEDDDAVDGSLLALLGRIAAEVRRENAKTYEKQLLLAA